MLCFPNYFWSVDFIDKTDYFSEIFLSKINISSYFFKTFELVPISYEIVWELRNDTLRILVCIFHKSTFILYLFYGSFFINIQRKGIILEVFLKWSKLLFYVNILFKNGMQKFSAIHFLPLTSQPQDVKKNSKVKTLNKKFKILELLHK